MQALLSKLPAFALPFVTRSLRGGRGKRYIIFSLLLASLTGIMGLWIALGAGNFEQSLRIEFDVEDYEFERERAEFTVLTHDALEQREAEDELRVLVSGRRSYDSVIYGNAFELYDHGLRMLEMAAWSPAYAADDEALRAQAIALLSDRIPTYQLDVYERNVYDPSYAREMFPWHDKHQRQMLEVVIAKAGVPDIETYASPLSFHDALKLTVFFAGIILASLVTVFGPLLVAVQQAQERHENTLMPLTGTALDARELTLGLSAGPMAVVAIFAVPQLLIFMLCALLAGEFAVAMAMIAAMIATGALFMFGGQLLGQLLGHKRTPGIIGIALMMLTGVAWLSGAGLMFSADHNVAGVSAILPHLGLAALLAEVFVEIPANFSRVFVGAFAWTGGAVVLSWLMLTALARRIEGRNGPLLGALPALLGAATCVVLVNVALPTDIDNSRDAIRHFLGLAMLAFPLALLLMARVPTGDGPAKMRKVPVPALLGEFAAWGAIHAFAIAVLFGTDLQAMHPVSLLWMAWCIGVLGLIAIRVVSVPSTVASSLWAGFCGMSLILGFAQAMFWGVDRGHHDFEDVFVMMQLSPVLGLIQLALTIYIPVSLVRHLRKNLGSIR